MTNMTVYNAFFEPVKTPIVPSSKPSFKAFEQWAGSNYVVVQGVLWRFWPTCEFPHHRVFSLVLPASDVPQLFLYFDSHISNLHQEAGIAIGRWLKDNPRILEGV